MDEEERARRTEAVVEEIRQRQADMGHKGPTPAFLSLLTDKIVEYDYKLEQLENRLAALEG